MKELILTLAAVSTLARGAAPARPTALESYAKSTTARIVWTSEVGRLVSTEATIVITALAVQDPSRSPYQMKGVRIDLSTSAGSDQLYIAAEDLTSMVTGFDQIGKDLKRFETSTTPSARNIGAPQFWNPDNTNLVHTLTASFHSAPPAGMTLSAYSTLRFHFPGHMPVEFSDLFRSASVVLASR